MIINEELRPCPFCGREAEAVEFELDSAGNSSLRVCCSCGADIRLESDQTVSDWEGNRYQFGMTAIDKYNRRASDDAGL